MIPIAKAGPAEPAKPGTSEARNQRSPEPAKPGTSEARNQRSPEGAKLFHLSSGRERIFINVSTLASFASMSLAIASKRLSIDLG